MSVVYRMMPAKPIPSPENLILEDLIKFALGVGWKRGLYARATAMVCGVALCTPHVNGLCTWQPATNKQRNICFIFDECR